MIANTNNMKFQHFIKKYQTHLPLIEDITLSYPLSESLIEKYRDVFNWDLLLANEKIHWDFEFLAAQISYLRSKQNTNRIFHLPDDPNPAHLPCSEDLYFLFNPTTPDFYHFSRNSCVAWNTQLLERYKDRWYWEDLSFNEGIPFTESLISQFLHDWDWDALSSNTGIAFSLSLLEQFDSYWLKNALSMNPAFHSQFELLDRYQTELDWWYISSSSPLMHSPEIRTYFEKHVSFEGLLFNEHCKNLNLDQVYSFLTDKTIHNNKRVDFWFHFSRSGNLKDLLNRAPNLISDFASHLSFSELSGNMTLPFDDAFISQFETRWDWKRLSQKCSIHQAKGSEAREFKSLSMQSIECFSKYWDWEVLSQNWGIDWDMPVLSQIPGSHV